MIMRRIQGGTKHDHVPLLPVDRTVRILEEFPHDVDSFTQGLEFHGGYLFETTGWYGDSLLRKMNVTTGEVVQEYKFKDRYFGEGMTILHDKIYALTWKEKTGFVFDLDFNLLRTWNYDTQGWGITHINNSLVYSDGTDMLYWADPDKDMNVFRTMSVTDDSSGAVVKVKLVNELEFMDGMIFANIWKQARIAMIDPTSGNVVEWIDGLPLVVAAGKQVGHGHCLNGIALNHVDGALYLTGKHWPKVYKVDRGAFAVDRR